MYYNIVLNSLGPKTDPKGLRIIKKLSCENIDLIESGTYPVIICRYATKEEKDFYEQIKQEYDFDLVFKPIKSSEDVFEVFNIELKQGEQEDIHLKERAEIISRLQDGLDVLENKQECSESFAKASQSIVSKIKEREEGIKSKLQLKSMWLGLIASLVIVVCLFVLPFFTLSNKILFSLIMASVLMVGTFLYDFINYKKRKEYYNSVECYLQLINDLTALNYSKNIAIHRIENMIDTLQVRRCLTILPTQERELSIVKDYLKQLLTLKSINEIFSLH